MFPSGSVNSLSVSVRHLHGDFQRNLHHVGERVLPVRRGQLLPRHQIVGDGADGQRPLAGIGGAAGRIFCRKCMEGDGERTSGIAWGEGIYGGRGALDE